MPKFNGYIITEDGSYELDGEAKANKLILDISGEFDGAALIFKRKPQGHNQYINVATISHNGTSTLWKISEDITLSKDDGILILSALHDRFEVDVSGSGSATSITATLNVHEY